MILPHGKELIGFIPLEELYTTYAYHERLQVFAEKGLECVSCGCVGTLLAFGRETSLAKHSRKRETIGAVHIDLYTDDFTLMTVDHIIPKKMCKELGIPYAAMESLDNKQTMCDPCNGAKGHKIFTEKEALDYQKQMTHNKTQKKKYNQSKIVLELVPNIHAMLGNKHEVTA